MLSEQEQVRREKLNKIREVCNPYPDRYEKTHELKDAKNLADGTKDVRIAGRIVFARKMGKLSFVKIRDIEGDMQLEFKIDEVGEEKYDFFKKLIDVGDFIGACGEIFTTQTGEKTLRVHTFEFLGKALKPLPEKFHGLTDIETKYRERYVDLIMNEDTRKVFIGRSKLYHYLHKFLGENLRIAPETYLKQCIAGGFSRVYEVSKCFRNEGMDTEHLQEFTQVEWYVSYWNFEDNIKFYQKFIRGLLTELTGGTTIEYQGHVLDFGTDNWKRINYVEEMTKILGFDFLNIEDPQELKDKIVSKGLFTYEDLEEYKSLSQIIDFAYKRLIRANIIEPTIIYNYPAVLIPLARRNDQNNKVIDVFQVLVCGTELCKAYSELVNPIVQRETFAEQLKAKEQGDEETMEMDETFLGAMEQGMPPISGLGFGIPSVRDVVLFPLMKPNDK